MQADTIAGSKINILYRNGSRSWVPVSFGVLNGMENDSAFATDQEDPVEHEEKHNQSNHLQNGHDGFYIFRNVRGTHPWAEVSS
jgi:hypothetical protein